MTFTHETKFRRFHLIGRPASIMPVSEKHNATEQSEVVRFVKNYMMM